MLLNFKDDTMNSYNTIKIVMVNNKQSARSETLSFSIRGDGYVVSNDSYTFDTDEFVVELDFKFTRIGDIGTLVCASNLEKTDYFYVRYDSNSDKITCNIRGFGSEQKSDYVIVLQLYSLLIDNKWYHFTIKKDDVLWSLSLDDQEYEENLSDLNSPVYDLNVYFGCTNLYSEPSLGFFITSMKVNDLLLTCDTTDFKVYGSITTSCYNTDALAIQYPLRLECNDFCTTPYMTNYTADTPWDKLQCCHNVSHFQVPDIGPNDSGDSPFLAYQYGDNTNVQFIYDRNSIDNINQVDNALRIYGYQGKVIQNAFCESKTNTDCPPDMKNGCSRFFAVNEEGDYCRDLFNKKSDVEKDISIFNYCTRNDTNECKCVNRVYNSDYLKLKQGNPYLDSCWYIPCANSTRYLIPSELKRHGECPENICQIVFDISQAHDVDIDHIKADINCDFSGGGWPNHIVPWYYIVALVLCIVLLLVYTLT